VIAPRGTPTAIVNKLASELAVIVANAEVRERFLSQGIAPASTTPDVFAATIRQNIARFAKVIRELGLKVE
jgi:tripartite-type tricarboxylate transporter receptor subunit TctC